MAKLSHKLGLGLVVSTLAMAGAATSAQAQDVSVTTGVDLVTDYVFRGASLADTAVQPYAEASVGNFTAGVWFSAPSGDTSVAAADEIDIYAGYSLPVSDTFSVDLGVTYYHYPQFGGLFSTSGSIDSDLAEAAALDEFGDLFGLDEDDLAGAFEGTVSGTYEISAAVGFDLPLAPSIAAYYDLTLDNFTLEGALGHSVGVGEKQGLDLGLTVGLVDGEDGFSYEWATATAAVSHSFTDAVSAYVGANYTLNSEDVLDYKKVILGTPKDNLFWAGVGISAGF